MALYTIKEMYDYYKGNTTLYPSTCFMGGNSWIANVEIPTDLPDYVIMYQNFYNGWLDPQIARKFGAWRLCYEADSIADAYDIFVKENIMHEKMHRVELKKIFEAINSEFNPVENYDRYEDATVSNNGNTTASSTGTGLVAPDDAETFFNTSQSDSSASSTTQNIQGTTSHIHGNIGVVDAPTMIDRVLKVFSNASWYDAFIGSCIENCCFLVD